MPTKKEIADLIRYVVLNEDDIAYTHPAFLQCFLPLRPKSDRTFHKVTHGKVSLAIEAGHVIAPDRQGHFEQTEVPAGPKARLIFPYINDQAFRTKNPRINMGHSLREFMRRNAIPIGGPNGKELERQIRNIAGASIVLGEWQEDRAIQRHAKITEEISFWIEKDSSQFALWQPELQLSEAYMKALLGRRVVPVNFPALVALQHNARAMDVFSWLSLRLYALKTRTLIPYEAVRPIFGADLAGAFAAKNFRSKFRQTIALVVKTVYPEARVELHDDYFALFPSPPAVPRSAEQRTGAPMLKRQ